MFSISSPKVYTSPKNLQNTIRWLNILDKVWSSMFMGRHNVWASDPRRFLNAFQFVANVKHITGFVVCPMFHSPIRVVYIRIQFRRSQRETRHTLPWATQLPVYYRTDSISFIYHRHSLDRQQAANNSRRASAPAQPHRCSDICAKSSAASEVLFTADMAVRSRACAHSLRAFAYIFELLDEGMECIKRHISNTTFSHSVCK